MRGRRSDDGMTGSRRRWLSCWLLATIVAASFSAVTVVAPADPPSGPQPSDEAAREESIRERAARRDAATAAERERLARSRRAYAGVSRAEAIGIAKDRHPDIVLQPAWRGPHLLPGQRVAEYLGDHAARLSGELPGGGRTIVASLLPLRAPDEQGDNQPVDLTLVERGTALVARNPLTDVRIPKALGDGVALADTGISITPVGVGSPEPVIVGDTAFFADALRDADVIVKPSPAGFSVNVQVRSEDAPERFRLRIGAPDDRTLRVSPAGDAVLVKHRENLVASVGMPRAWDADHRELDIEWRLDGRDLVMDVPHRGHGGAYPYVIDPYVDRAASDWFDWERSGNHDFDGWTWWQNNDFGPYNGTGYLGTGLYLRALDWSGANPIHYSHNQTGNWSFKAQGTAEIYGAEWNLLTQDYAQDTCVYAGIRRRTGASVQWEPSAWEHEPYQNCGVFYNVYVGNCNGCTPGWSTPGNLAVFGVRMEGTRPRSYWVAHLGVSYVHLFDDSEPSVTLNGPRNPGESDWGDWPATTPVDVTFRDAGLGVRRAALSAAGWTGGAAVAQGSASWAAGVADWCERIATCPPEFKSTGNQQPERNATVKDMPQGKNLVSVHAEDPAENTSPIQHVEVKLDRDVPEVEFSGAAKERKFVRRGEVLTITGKDGARVPNARQRAGMQHLDVEMQRDGDPLPIDPPGDAPPDVPSCPQSSCEIPHDQALDVDDGTWTVRARGTDQIGHQMPGWATHVVNVDSAPPAVAVSGTLRDQVASVTGGDYDVRVDATDGTEAQPRSGVKRITISMRRPGSTTFETVRTRDQECPNGSCTMRLDWIWRTDRHPDGTYRFRVVAEDQLGHASEPEEWDVVLAPRPLQPGIGNGLEDFWMYESVQTGAGTGGHVNLANGNFVWHAMPMANPGRGLSSIVNVTYNAHARLGDVGFSAPLGDGFSMGISSLTRINERLDVTTAAIGGVITLFDADGTRHVFHPSDDGSDLDLLPDHYIAPAGVQIHLRRFSPFLAASVAPTTADSPAWAATRPDGVTHFFNEFGVQTGVADRNGNRLEFEYEIVLPDTGLADTCDVTELDPGNLGGCVLRLAAVEDSAGVVNGEPGRKLLLRYWTAAQEDSHDESDEGADDPGPEAGKLRDVTDHGGRVLAFRYDESGRLRRMTQAEQSPVERSFDFAWGDETSGAKLEQIVDPRGATTTIAYEDSAATDPTGQVRRATGITDRRGARRALLYANRADDSGTQATVHGSRAFEGLGATAPPRSGFDTVDLFDRRGRVERITDAHRVASGFAWDDDNNMVRIVEADSHDASEAVTAMAYDDNGQLTDVTDPQGHVTQLRYREGSGTHLTSVDSGAGQSNDADERFVSDLERITTPRGVVSSADGDFTTRFVLDSTGLVRERWESGEPAPMRFGYTTFGELNRAETELGNTTTYEQFDSNGLPEVEIDERGNASAVQTDGRWVSEYDEVGRLRAVTDPRGHGDGGPTNRDAPYTTSFEYDALDRPVTEHRSKRSDVAPVQFIDRSFGYDANGNRTRVTDGEGHDTIAGYTPMDEPERQESPPVAHAGDSATTPPTRDVSRTFYDHAGNVVRTEAPRGDGTASTVDFVTDYVYDNLDRLVVEAPRSSSDRHREMVTSYGYDVRGNVRRVADPRGNASSFAQTDTFEQKVAKARNNVDDTHPSYAQSRLRALVTYDSADRVTEQTEAPARSGLALRTTFEYDENDNLIGRIDPRGHAENRASAFEWTFEYDERDQRTDVFDPHDNRTRTSYRHDGLVAKVTTPRGTADDAAVGRDDPFWETAISYDPAGDMIAKTVPRARGQYGVANPRWRFVRNEVGDPRRIIDPRGHDEGSLRDRYAFDNEFLDTGQLRFTERPSFWGFSPGDSPEVDLRGLNGLGNEGKQPHRPTAGVSGDFADVEPEPLPGILPRAGDVTFTYDDELRLTSVREDATGTGTECDEEGLDVGTAAAACVRLMRDALGRVTAVRRPLDRDAADPLQRTIEERLAYDRNGNLAEQIDGEGHGTLLHHDEYDRLLREDRPGSGGSERAQTQHTYDVNGNVERTDFPRAGTNSRMTYDDVDRVLTERNGMTYKYDLARTRQPVDGERFTYSYDAAGNVKSVRSPRGHDDAKVNQTTNATCDAGASAGDRTTSYERRCFETERFYDELDQLTEERDGFGIATKFEYDENGSQDRVDAPGAAAAPGGAQQRVVTTRDFDGRGLLWRETTGTGIHERTRITEFDPIGNLRRVVNPAGVNKSQTPRRPVFADTRERPSAHGTAADRDDAALRDAAFHATVYEYSPDNILTAQHLPWALGDRSSDESKGDVVPRYRIDFEVNERGFVGSSSSPWDWANGQEERLVATYSHYDTGWIAEAQDPTYTHEGGATGGGQRFDYQYDRRGMQQLWRARTRGGAVRRIMTRDYHPSGLMSRRSGRTGENDPTSLVYTYGYDANRNLTGMVDHRGSGDTGRGDWAAADTDDRETTVEYDAADRRLRVHSERRPSTAFKAPSQDTIFIRDPDGNTISRFTDGTGTAAENYSSSGKWTRFWFDPLGREYKTVVARSGSPTRTWTTTYYGSGQRAKRVKTREATSFQDEWFFADDSRLIAARRGVESSPQVRKDQQYAYDDNGNRSQDERGIFGYNGRGQVVYWKRSGRMRNGETEVRYWVDGLGRVTRKDDAAPALDGGGRTTTDYDGYELDWSELASKDAAMGTWKTDYTYDSLNGDATRIDTERVGVSSTSRFTQYRYDAFGRLTGSRRSGDAAGVYPRQFQYDGLDRREQRCVNASGDGCAGGRRIDLTYVGLGERLSAELPHDGANTDTKDFDYGPDGEPLGVHQWSPSSNAFDYRSYGLAADGSVEVLQKRDGSWFESAVGGGEIKTDRYDYDPYGQLQPFAKQKAAGGDQLNDGENGLTDEAKGNPVRYQGFYYDAAFKSYDMHARAYRPDAGRFLTLDRYESARGDFELQADPLTNNRYAFAGNNPVNNIEFDGHFGGNEGGAQEAMKPRKKRTGETEAQAENRHEQPGRRQAVDDPEAAADASDTGNADTADRTHRTNTQQRIDAAHRDGGIRRVRRHLRNHRTPHVSPHMRKSRAAYPGQDPVAPPESKPTGGVDDLLGGVSCEFTIDIVCFGDKNTELHGAGRVTAMLNPKGIIQKGAREGVEAGAERIAREGGEEGGERGAKRAARGGSGTAARCEARRSFSGVTRVLMPDGTARAISEIKVGDMVLAADPLTGARAARRVTHVWAHDDTLADLSLGGASVTTTEDHPFWNATDRQWQDASALELGERVLSASNKVVTVGGFAPESARAGRAYNLTVHGMHTYFVAAGAEFILVHNTGCTNIDDLPARAARNLTENQDYAFQRLNRNHGVTRIEFREQVHAIKQAHDLPGDFSVKFGPTGDVWNPNSGDLIGTIVHAR